MHSDLIQDARRWRKLVKASEVEFPPMTLCVDPENNPLRLYGKVLLERAIDELDLTKTVPCPCCNGSGKKEVSLGDEDYQLPAEKVYLGLCNEIHEPSTTSRPCQ